MISYSGIIVGSITFLLIGIFHPLVVKGEYYFGKNIYIIFLIVGIISLALSLFIENVEFSSILAVLGFTSLWSVKEVFEQVQRVNKGWFPKNPNRKE